MKLAEWAAWFEQEQRRDVNRSHVTPEGWRAFLKRYHEERRLETEGV